MNEVDNNTKEQEVKTSKLAIFSLVSPIILFITGYIIKTILPTIISPLVGICLGVKALVSIKKSKGKLKGIGFALSGIIISFIIIVIFTCVAFVFISYLHEKPYNDSNPEAILNKVESYCDFEVPQKIENLRAAEKITGGIDHEYTFVARFKTDRKSFEELRNSLSKTKFYSEEKTEELSSENSNSYDTFGSLASNSIGTWQKNAPEWYDAEIPKGKVYELWPWGKMVLCFICVELPDSNDVVVHIEGWGGDRALKDTVLKP